MSQSDEHRDLVLQVVEALENRYPLMTFIADVQKKPGDEVPPLIDGFRPDVYASKEPSSSTIIAEAKTARKIFSKHTNNQILAFVNYLERRKNGFFVLSVNGCGADSARTLLRFIRQGTQVKRTALAVFDGCDFWLLDSSDGATWHLS